MKLPILISVLFFTCVIEAQLVVTTPPPKLTGQKAVIRLDMRNDFPETIESARAAVFLLDHDGKMVGQATRWVIGGGAQGSPGLAPGATNNFNFVITTEKPFTTTNLTSKVNFTRVVLEGGKLADINKDVQIRPAQK